MWGGGVGLDSGLQIEGQWGLVGLQRAVYNEHVGWFGCGEEPGLCGLGCVGCVRCGEGCSKGGVVCAGKGMGALQMEVLGLQMEG